MVDTATWLGQLEWDDYDILVRALLDGTLHPSLPKNIDGDSLGVTGGSHGGIASFLYPRFSAFNFALAMPFEGTPGGNGYVRSAVISPGSYIH
jgi:hypothetical protein